MVLSRDSITLAHNQQIEETLFVIYSKLYLRLLLYQKINCMAVECLLFVLVAHKSSSS